MAHLSTPHQLHQSLLGRHRAGSRQQNDATGVSDDAGLRTGGEDGAERGTTLGNLPRAESFDHFNAYYSGGVEPEGISSVIVSTYNLTSTILGAGILSIPHAISRCGLVLGVVLLVLTSMASTLSCNLVLSAYLRTSKGSYGDLALVLFGPLASSTIKWCIIVLNVGAAAGYMLVVKSLLPKSLCQLVGGVFCGDDLRDTVVLACIVFLVIFPLCTLKNLSSLRHTSLLAFGFAVFLTIAIMVRAMQFDSNCPLQLWPEDSIGVFKALPVFCFAFVCHLNVLPVYDQLESRTPDRMRTVFRNAISFALLLYSLCGAFGYTRFRCATSGVPDNILAFGDSDGYFAANDVLLAFARVAEALTCTLALPLIQHPTRVALHSWLFNETREEDVVHDGTPRMGQSADLRILPPTLETGSETDQVDDIQGHGSSRRYKQELCCLSGRSLRRLEAFGILSVSFSIALLVPNLSFIFGILGATCCSLVCFILPGLFYLRATKDVVRSFQGRVYGTKEHAALARLLSQRRLAFLMLLFGLFLCVAGTIFTFF